MSRQHHDGTVKLGTKRSGKNASGILAWILCLVLVLSACGQGNDPGAGEPIDEDADDQPVELTEEPVEEPIPLPFTFPLTGLESDRDIKERPVMVMVENSPAARPQTGLHEADIVFEILAEGDITRFVAVYQTNSPKVIGPVRSIRPYYAEIGDGLDALIVHAGWSQEAINIIKKRKLAHFDQVYGDDKYYWRDKTRKAPHNLYTSIELIRQGAEAKKYREEWNGPILTFAGRDIQITEGTEAVKIVIPYLQKYNVTYEYDAEHKQYNRVMAGTAHKDKETETQITAVNILICESKHKILDNIGRRAVDVFGPGPGYLVQEGKVREVTWENVGGIIRPFAEGKEIPLLRGKTWIQVVPNLSKVTFE